MKWFNEKELEEAGEHYSENKLFDKIGKFAGKEGIEIIYYALIAYYTLKSPEISSQDKIIIIGALGYFILPVDLILDTIPIGGFADDIAVLLFALIKQRNYINEDILEKSSLKLKTWFNVPEEKIRILNKKFD